LKYTVSSIYWGKRRRRREWRNFTFKLPKFQRTHAHLHSSSRNEFESKICFSIPVKERRSDFPRPIPKSFGRSTSKFDLEDTSTFCFLSLEVSQELCGER
jgi:hypothetical protein